MYARYLKNKTPEILKEYKQLRNKVTHLKENAKYSYYKNLFQNAKNTTDTWKYINQLLRKRKQISEKLSEETSFPIDKSLQRI